MRCSLNGRLYGACLSPVEAAAAPGRAAKAPGALRAGGAAGGAAARTAWPACCPCLCRCSSAAPQRGRRRLHRPGAASREGAQLGGALQALLPLLQLVLQPLAEVLLLATCNLSGKESHGPGCGPAVPPRAVSNKVNLEGRSPHTCSKTLCNLPAHSGAATRSPSSSGVCSPLLLGLCRRNKSCAWRAAKWAAGTAHGWYACTACRSCELQAVHAWQQLPTQSCDQPAHLDCLKQCKVGRLPCRQHRLQLQRGCEVGVGGWARVGLGGAGGPGSVGDN